MLLWQFHKSLAPKDFTWGNCESRNAGTWNGSKMRAVCYHHRTRRASLFTGLVDWTGLTKKSVKCLFQCRTEANHTYSFTKLLAYPAFVSFLESVEVKGLSE